MGDGEDCVIVSGLSFFCASQGAERGVGEVVEGCGSYFELGRCTGVEYLGWECEMEEMVGLWERGDVVV